MAEQRSKLARTVEANQETREKVLEQIKVLQMRLEEQK